MKITCTLSEYTKMARQCGELKARFNCRTCPLNGVADLAEGESCDIERFVKTIETPGVLMLHNTAEKLAGAVPEGCLHVRVPRARGEGLETR